MMMLKWKEDDERKRDAEMADCIHAVRFYRSRDEDVKTTFVAVVVADEEEDDSDDKEEDQQHQHQHEERCCNKNQKSHGFFEHWNARARNHGRDSSES